MLPVILIVIIIILCNMNNNQIRYFNNKISIMKEYINNNEEYKNLVKNTVNNGVVISISDGNTKAIVKYSKKNNIEEDFKNSVNQLKRYIQKNRYTTQWVKIDFINNVQSIKVSNLEEALNNYTIDDIIQYGMMFESENSYIILTKEELNSNDIINYQENSINKDNLNTYLDYIRISSKKQGQ